MIELNKTNRHNLSPQIGGIGNAEYGFYDPILNAVFLHAAGDSRDDSQMWVFRYKSPN